MTKGVGYGRMELQHGVENPDLTMRRVSVLSLLGALLPLLPSPSSAAPVCPDSLSTADQTRCLMKELEASDRQLQEALMGVAKEAKQVPGPTF